MTTRNKRLLVIDTSVVCAAGQTEHPISSACREILYAVLNICHHAAVTTSMQKEWKDHMSHVSILWRSSMHVRKKLKTNFQPEKVFLDCSQLSDGDRHTIEKDWHMLEAALSADRVILTRDNSFRRALEKTPQGARLLSSITWIDPMANGLESVRSL
jgi:rRNA-processing protein FCF1